MLKQRPVVHVHALSAYGFGTKAPPQRDAPAGPDAQLARLEACYAAEGARRSVLGVLLAAEHGRAGLCRGCSLSLAFLSRSRRDSHPHVLLLRQEVPGGPPVFRLPGGRLRPGEEEGEGLRRKLASKLLPSAGAGAPRPAWELGETVATWTRPGFSAQQYPYCPPHVARPKETTRLVLVHLPERALFAVPRTLTLHAVPLFDLHANELVYGPLLAALPACLSRFHLNLASD